MKCERRLAGAARPTLDNPKSSPEIDRLPILPAGQLHPRGKCWWCGSTEDLKQTIILWTHARGFVCRDAVSCNRRRNASRVAA
jgi:hypothetical protein